MFHINKEAIDLAEIETPKEAQAEEKQDVEIKKDSIEVETKELSIPEIQKQLKQVKLKIPSIDKGYYLITNVFSKPNYAKKWEDFLKSKGYAPRHFVNPKNNWQYVHVYNNEDIRAVYKTYQKLVKLDYFKEIWVFKINMD